MGNWLSRVLQRLLGGNPRGADDPEHQAGAVPYRQGPDGLEFLMITARTTGQWIFPKGSEMEQLSCAESAALEAYEEAGVRGRIDAHSAGSYRDVKPPAKGGTVIDVDLYPLEVETELEEWPEREFRQRRWARLSEASKLLAHPGMVKIAEEVARRVQRS